MREAGAYIDDAIRSRCVAVIRYDLPTEGDCARIWRVMADNYEVKLSNGLISELVTKFGRLPGRDIKNLMRLTDKFCRARKQAPDMAAFTKCGMFRSL